MNARILEMYGISLTIFVSEFRFSCVVFAKLDSIMSVQLN